MMIRSLRRCCSSSSSATSSSSWWSISFLSRGTFLLVLVAATATIIINSFTTTIVTVVTAAEVNDSDNHHHHHDRHHYANHHVRRRRTEHHEQQQQQWQQSETSINHNNMQQQMLMQQIFPPPSTSSLRSHHRHDHQHHHRRQQQQENVDAEMNNNTVRSRRRLSGGTINSYFNDTNLYFDTMTIIQTHNSLALPGLVLSPNQNYDLVTQFQDGIRGFNLDLYSDGDDDNSLLWTYHGFASWGYDPSSSILDLVTELQLPSNRQEMIVIEIQDAMNPTTVDKFLELFQGNDSILIRNFDTSLPFSHYININQRILIMTPNNNNVDPSRGLHDTKIYTYENRWEWDTNTCYNSMSTPPTNERYPNAYPKVERPAVVMNHFCVNPTFRSGDMVAAQTVNNPNRIVQSANGLLSTVNPTIFPRVNIILVDYYEIGYVFEAQRQLRNGDNDNNNENENESVGGDDGDDGDDQDEDNDNDQNDNNEPPIAGSPPQNDPPPPQEEEEECWPTNERCTTGMFGSTCDDNCCSKDKWLDILSFTYRCK